MSTQLISEVLKMSLESNGILQYFNNLLMGVSIDGEEFMPDINGYSLIFMMPPDLSGFSLGGGVKEYMQIVSKKFVFLAIDFTPPAIQVTSAQVSGTSGGIPYGTKVSKGGQCSITFLDTSELNTFSYHKVWVDYIDKITKGSITPSENYLDPKNSDFGSIDYMASAYVIRMKPVAGASMIGDDIVYVGKATGIFPLNVPDKEIIGKRDSNELTTLPMNYACARYEARTMEDVAGLNSWIFYEFMTDCGSMYMDL